MTDWHHETNERWRGWILSSNSLPCQGSVRHPLCLGVSGASSSWPVTFVAIHLSSSASHCYPVLIHDRARIGSFLNVLLLAVAENPAPPWLPATDRLTLNYTSPAEMISVTNFCTNLCQTKPWRRVCLLAPLYTTVSVKHSDILAERQQPVKRGGGWTTLYKSLTLLYC